MRTKKWNWNYTIKALVLFCLLQVSSSFFLYGETKKAEKPIIIKIKYSNLINGYKVKVLWKPEYTGSASEGGGFVGPAIIKFSKNGKFAFSVKSEVFVMGIPELEAREDGTVRLKDKNIKSSVIEHSLPEPQQGKELGNAEFFFQDIDFDQIPELILTYPGRGQRHYPAYAAYKIDGNKAQKMVKEPFNQLDGLTQFNYSKKQIFIESSGGACDSSYYTYTFQPPKKQNEKSKIIETEITEYNSLLDGETGCFESEYKIINGHKKLISRKKN